jgi:hypothetical protein
VLLPGGWEFCQSRRTSSTSSGSLPRSVRTSYTTIKPPSAEKPPRVVGEVRLSLGDEILRANERACLRLRRQGRLDQFPQIIAEAIGTASEPLVVELKRRAPEMLQEHAELRADFEQSLASHWKHALDLYEIIMVACEEVGPSTTQRTRRLLRKRAIWSSRRW